MKLLLERLPTTTVVSVGHRPELDTSTIARSP